MNSLLMRALCSTLPNANARERLANDPQLDTFNSSRTDGRPLSTNNGNRGRSASASDNGQMNKLKGYKEVDGGVVPKAADEAVRATRHSAGGNQKPQLIKEEDAAHRDEWGGNGTKSKL